MRADLQAFVRRDFELGTQPVSLDRFARWLMTEETSARGRSFFLPIHFFGADSAQEVCRKLGFLS